MPIRRIGALLATAALLGSPGLALAAGTVTTSPAAAGGTEAVGSPASETTAPQTTPSAPAVTTTTAPPGSAGAPAAPATTPAGQERVLSTLTLTRRSTGSSLSTGAILAAVAGGLLLLAVLTWGVFRWGAFEPHWLLTLRHSLAEAGFRLSATAAELGDWARLGR
jgi:hypothetical protein